MRKDIFTNASIVLALLLCGGAMAEAVPASVSTARFDIDTFSWPREIKTSEELAALYDVTYFAGETVSITAPGGSVTELVSSAAADGEVALPINASGIWTLVNSKQGSSSIAVRYSIFGSGGEGTAESPARAVSAGEFAELVAQGKTAFVFDDGFYCPPGTVIDLKGTYVKMPSSTACGSIAFTVTNTTEEDGTLEVEVPQGVTATNSGMTLTGNLRLVKSGPGTLIAGLRSQTYSGGTEVVAGVLMAKYNGAANGGHLFGEYDSQIVIRAGATFDLNAQPQNNNYLYVLDGGTITSSASGFGDTNIILKDIILTADSAVNGQNNIGLIHGGYAPTSLDLGGHTLTINIATAKYFYLINTEVKNGTIDVVHGGWLQTGNASRKDEASGVVASNVNFKVNGALNLYAPMSMGGYEAIYGGSNGGTVPLKVYGVFKPSDHNYFYGCTLQDGAVMDLSARTSTLPLVSSCTGGKTNLEFAVNATIKIKLGDWAVGVNDCIVSWNSAPSNLDTLTFKSVDDESFRVVVKSDGLYTMRGLVISIR